MKNAYLKLGIVLTMGLLFISCEKDDGGGSQNLETAQLYASNNTNGNVTVYDMVNGEVKTLTTASTASEGIYYDADKDEVIQASRSTNRLNAYSNITATLLGAIASTTISASVFSTSDLESPRDIAVKDNFVVVSDNADVDGNSGTSEGRFFIYTRTDGELTLRNVITTDFAVWGIEFVDDNLYAVVDKTNELAVYTNFTATNTTNATVSASKRIAIEGIVRTHGLAYDKGTMILTDVGSAMDDDDGAFHVITNFDSKFNAVANGSSMVVANNQTRIAGSNTLLGNPVSAEYDADSKTVFIAEAANGGGRVLTFSNLESEGNITPSTNSSLSKASSLYFYSNR